jgi:hypothetical protein
MQDFAQVVSELDEMHAQLMGALARKDRHAYRDVFSPELTYRHLDGRVIDRDRLMREVAGQFRYYRKYHWSIVRESIVAEEGRAVEILAGRGHVVVSGFFIVHRIWRLTRRGRYVWKKEEGRWRISEVEVLEEQIREGPIRLKLRAPKLDSGTPPS